MSHYNNETLIEQDVRIAALEAENAELRKDAERYRTIKDWLFLDGDGEMQFIDILFCSQDGGFSSVDAFIDTMKEAQS